MSSSPSTSRLKFCKRTRSSRTPLVSGAPIYSGRKSKTFTTFTILLNEDKNAEKINQFKEHKQSSQPGNSQGVSDDIIKKLGKLIQVKIQAHCHSQDKVDLFSAEEIIANNMKTLVSIMFRLATEDFVRKSSATFKIIECRNATKLSTDWKPSLVDVAVSLGQQVILVELTDYPHYTDFVYSILRQITYKWNIRLPRSFFYPDDVCEVDYCRDQQVVVVTPLLPDGDMDLTTRLEDHLKHEIFSMIKESCSNGLKNHLLKRDLRVGRLCDTENGFQSIRYIYRTLQRRLRTQGSNIQMGKNSEDFHQFLLSVAGDSLMSAESYIEYCKNPQPETPRTPRRNTSKSRSTVDSAGDHRTISIPACETKSQAKNTGEITDASGDTKAKGSQGDAGTVKKKSDEEDEETDVETLDKILQAIKDLDYNPKEITIPHEVEIHTPLMGVRKYNHILDIP